jgi:hypothetical protein
MIPILVTKFLEDLKCLLLGFVASLFVPHIVSTRGKGFHAKRKPLFGTSENKVPFIYNNPFTRTILLKTALNKATKVAYITCMHGFEREIWEPFLPALEQMRIESHEETLGSFNPEIWSNLSIKMLVHNGLHRKVT